MGTATFAQYPYVLAGQDCRAEIQDFAPPLPQEIAPSNEAFDIVDGGQVIGSGTVTEVDRDPGNLTPQESPWR